MSNQKTILIVDDDIDLLEQTSVVVGGAGYKIVTADSEKTAMEILETNVPDLAIFDLMMENMDSGFILSRKLKEIDEKVPVIIVTAVTSETGLHFETDGANKKSWIKADAIIDKGIRYEQLLSKISDLLN
jgi:CheY-like chemotaxis protein